MQQIFNGFYSYHSCRRYLLEVPMCHLRLIKTASQHIALVTQIPFPLYTGLSVTNGYEEIATQIVEEFALDPKKTLFLEHYPSRGEGFGNEETWHVVRLTWEKEFILWGKKYAIAPTWERIYPQTPVKLILSTKESELNPTLELDT
jgi:hypothetical protein